MSKVHWTGIALISVVLAGCTAAKPTASAFASARQAIAQAEAVDAAEYAPVELRAAEAKLAEAERGMESREYDVAAYLIEQSEINAELAIARTRAARLRARVESLRSANEVLEADLQATFGEDWR